jgi:Acetyltransferase (GNAT) domain
MMNFAFNRNEQRATRPSFFLSATWANSYWKTAGNAGGKWVQWQLRTGDDDHLPTVLGIGTRLALGFKSVGRLALNRSLAAEMDDISIEENGHSAFEIGDDLTFWQALLSRFKDQSVYAELQLDALSKSQFELLVSSIDQADLLYWISSYRQTYWIDLNEIATEFKGDYLASRSANTRQQLRRYYRKLQDQYGVISLQVVESRNEITTSLDELGRYHLARWGKTPTGSGFKDFLFKDHHLHLFLKALDEDHIRFIRVSAGDTVVAFLVFFEDGFGWRFYIGATNPLVPAQFRAGRVAHLCAIEEAQKRGVSRYDFLGGTARYKESFCSHQQPQFSLVVCRKTIISRSEQYLRALKRQYFPAQPLSQSFD